jgi:hypothetical protein
MHRSHYPNPLHCSTTVKIEQQDNRDGHVDFCVVSVDAGTLRTIPSDISLWLNYSSFRGQESTQFSDDAMPAMTIEIRAEQSSEMRAS